MSRTVRSLFGRELDRFEGLWAGLRRLLVRRRTSRPPRTEAPQPVSGHLSDGAILASFGTSLGVHGVALCVLGLLVSTTPRRSTEGLERPYLVTFRVRQVSPDAEPSKGEGRDEPAVATAPQAQGDATGASRDAPPEPASLPQAPEPPASVAFPGDGRGAGPPGSGSQDASPAGSPQGSWNVSEVTSRSIPVPLGLGGGAPPLGSGRGGSGGGAFSSRGRGKAEALRKYGGGTVTEAAVARGLRWLAEHQDSDGGWGAAGYGRHCGA